MSLILVAPLAVAAAPAFEDDEIVRVIVRSQDPVLKTSLGVLYDWPAIGAFATNIPRSELVALQATGVDAYEDIPHQIALYRDETGPDQVSAKPGSGSTRNVPSDQTPYGIQYIYNDNTITSTSGGAGALLGHFDTGIDTDHPDLVNRIVSCISTVDRETCEDSNGHGTHTAGTAAADAGSDKLGIYGVAPEASIYTVKVCNRSGFCYTSDTLEAIDLCITAGCDVITYSIGGDSGNEDTRAAIINYKSATNGLFIAAAGNDGDAKCSIDYPGAFKEVISVASISQEYKVNSWSSRGCTTDSNTLDEDGELDLAAPGYQVESAYPDNTYDTLSGTSMATPHVAGLALKKGNTWTAITQNLLDITGDHGTSGEATATSGIDLASGHGMPYV